MLSKSVAVILLAISGVAESVEQPSPLEVGGLSSAAQPWTSIASLLLMMNSSNAFQSAANRVPSAKSQLASVAKMSAGEPASVVGSLPALDGVLLVTGPEGRETFLGRTQIVFGIMDTVVRDPFFTVAPKFFGMSESEFKEAWNRSAWLSFERGELEEAELQDTFFKDGRDFDLASFKAAIVEGYKMTDGMPELLQDLQDAGHKLHGFTDYPEWYSLIEDKLGVEEKHGLQWTSVSCDHGLLKTEPAAYLSLLRRLGVHRKIGAAPVILIDSKAEHCKDAEELGISSVQFGDVAKLRQALGDILGSRKRGTAPADGWPERVMR